MREKKSSYNEGWDKLLVMKVTVMLGLIQGVRV